MAKYSVGKRFGVLDDDQQRAMSGLEFVQGLVNGTLPLNTMAETLGYDIVEVSTGRTRSPWSLEAPVVAQKSVWSPKRLAGEDHVMIFHQLKGTSPQL